MAQLPEDDTEREDLDITEVTAESADAADADCGCADDGEPQCCGDEGLSPDDYEETEETEESEEARLQRELDERTDDLRRVSAEYANYRRRAERDRAAATESAQANLVAQLLPLLDDLELAESHGDLTGPLKALSDKLRGVLDGTNLTAIGEEGEEFDPTFHEAVQDTSSGDAKVLGTVLRKGYRMGDRVLRHAMVIIADPA